MSGVGGEGVTEQYFESRWMWTGSGGLLSRSEAQPKADWELTEHRGDRKEFQAGYWMCKDPVAIGARVTRGTGGHPVRL